MDWTRIIAKNKAVVAAVIAELFALLGAALSSPAKGLPRATYFSALSLLRPAESTLRRLIIMLARDVKVTLPPPRPAPPGPGIAAGREGQDMSQNPGPRHSPRQRPPRFRLYDPRKRFRPRTGPAPEPRGGPRVHFFYPRGPLIPAVFSVKTLWNGVHLCRRVAALKHAFDTLPAQALRLARWRLRRARTAGVKFTSPLRPGQPPGYRKRPRLAIEQALYACHGLAFEALQVNSS